MSADPNITAFICSSYQDLIEEREQVIAAVRALGLKVNSMESFGARVERPIRACLDEVKASDLLVVIVGNRYGSVGDPRSGISFTEAEYRLAVDLRKPCLVYLIDDSVGIPRHMREDDQTWRKLEAWKSDLMRRHTTASFRGADDLARRVMGDLHRTIMTLTRDLRHVGSARRARSSREEEALLDRVIAMVRRVEISRSDPAAETPDLDRSDVAELFRRYRKLGEPNPAILDGIGRLSLAVGSPRDALRRFHELAEMSNGQGDPEAEAEALFNGFRAGLEARDFAAAAWHLRKAWEVAPGKYALFPDRYRMHRILGVSGGGVDFGCQDQGASNASRTVRALLIDEFSDADRAALFQQIERLWQLSHPNVIDVVSCGWTDERQRRGPFVTIRPFAGTTLEEAVKGGTLSPKSFMALARKLASALNAAHGKDLIHRDVRPANVLVKLGPKRQLRECVLAGFGLALSPIQQLSYRERGEDRAGDVYLAPEQLGKLGSTPVAAKSDMVGFARTCYFALFGVPDPRPQMLAQVPAALARLLQHCAGSLPAVRPASFEDVYQQIKAVPPEAVNAWEDAWQRSQGTVAGTATTVAQTRTPPTAQCSTCDTLFPLNLNGAARQIVKCPACQQLLLATASAEADSGVAVEPAYVCACPQCKKPLQLRRECAGQQVKCGHCSAVSLPRYCLIVTHGEKPRVGWRLTKGQFLIGRERIAPLTFIDLSAQEPEDRTWISRGHARLVVTDKAIAIQDGLDEPSRNGTFVNQERIARPEWKLLRLGDEVKIGSVRLRVTVQ